MNSEDLHSVKQCKASWITGDEQCQCGEPALWHANASVYPSWPQDQNKTLWLCNACLAVVLMAED